MEALTWVVMGLLAVFTVRRLALLLGALLPPQAASASCEPSILVVVAAHNGEDQVRPLLESLEKLEYPSAKLATVLVSDGSSDGTARAFQGWADGRPGTVSLELHENVGKAGAINLALKTCLGSELFVVYDADQRPRPDSLRKLARAFSDPRVGAASGYRSPSNAGEGIVARYAALETWVHQFIVMAGKDRWGWNPPTMGGNCVYRVAAVAESGYFPDPTSSEDIEMSLRLIARGWRTRFVHDAVADNRIGQTLRHYASQRMRWTYGMYGAAKHARSLETIAVASGYADRLVFAAACLMFLAGWMPPVWLAFYLSAPFLQALTAVWRAGRFPQSPLFLGSAAAMFLFDVVTTGYSTLLTIAGRRPAWNQLADAAGRKLWDPRS